MSDKSAFGSKLFEQCWGFRKEGTKMNLLKEIKEKQQELVTIAERKNNCLLDPEIYERSCAIDKMIVELMKLRHTQILNKK